MSPRRSYPTGGPPLRPATTRLQLKPGGGGSRRHEREQRYRRALAVGLLISVAAHAGLLIYSERLGVRAPAASRPDEEQLPRAPGLVIVGVQEIPTPVPPDEARAEARRRPDETEVIELVPVSPAAGAEEPPPPEPAEPEDALTNAERLRPRFSDPRVWIDPRTHELYGDRLARYARADSAVRSILRDWLDSLALTDEERRRALDWTLKKGDERWGISPEGLHLGSITIPIPFGFAPSGPQRRAFEQALRDLQEIQRQNLQDDLEANRRARAEEMRRRSREEAERRRGGEEADTTSIGVGSGLSRR